MINFPFERSKVSTFGDLRTFERHLSDARKGDAELSKEWRIPTSPEAKRAVKIREETYPIKLLADNLSYEDCGTFQLTAEGFPNVDAIISSGGNRFNLQITIADPSFVTNAGDSCNGGFDFRLTQEALNNNGYVVGSSAMKREGKDIVSEKPVKTLPETFDACVRGIENALRRKIGRSQPGLHLLVDARGYWMNMVDLRFANIVNEAMRRVGKTSIDDSFEKYYFVSDGKGLYFEYEP